MHTVYDEVQRCGTMSKIRLPLIIILLGEISFLALKELFMPDPVAQLGLKPWGKADLSTTTNSLPEQWKSLAEDVEHGLLEESSTATPKASTDEVPRVVGAEVTAEGMVMVSVADAGSKLEAVTD
eukprot:gnl/TRDRNA2_/TRDRNA2_181013_c0_seq1.p1 gnl/TRDRNA2_/TRDRNA2_181013_c0~~gnl/TRDRNA2_/TRDRNA2_181013_c0_seq1.p1  ORF type:complete len:125 (+),score=23.08 gnl/TRDRNA2_/TRDRNA2_181013_c0_seq1:91-465(+)